MQVSETIKAAVHQVDLALQVLQSQVGFGDSCDTLSNATVHSFRWSLRLLLMCLQLKRTIVNVALWYGEYDTGFRFQNRWLSQPFAQLLNQRVHSFPEFEILQWFQSIISGRHLIACMSIDRMCQCMEEKHEGELRLLKAILTQVLQVQCLTSTSSPLYPQRLCSVYIFFHYTNNIKWD